jgi:uncharacterized delta-60 repeat protein
LLVSLLTFVCAAQAAADPGDLDRSFGGDGRVALPAAQGFVPRAVAVDGSERIVVGGYLCEPEPAGGQGTCLSSGNTSFTVARLTPDGGLDAEFGENGFVTTRVGEGRSAALDLLLVEGGRVLVGGIARSGGRDVFAIAGYGPDGSLDPGWGEGGIALAPVGTAYASLGDIAPGPNGTVLASGQALDAQGVPRIAVARFTPTGQLDGSFGFSGATLGGDGGYGYGLGITSEPDGSSLVAGLIGDSSDTATYRFSELRLTVDGEPDPSFGGDGVAEQAVGSSSSFANAVVRAPGGWIAAGAATVPDGRQAMAAVRVRAGGTLDPHFASRGRAIVPLLDGALANDVVRRGGRTVLVGQAATGGGYDFATVRLRADGSPDSAFGPAGAALVSWPDYPIARATAGAFQQSGKLITVGIGCAGGTRAECAGGTTRLLVARQFGGTDDSAPVIRVGRPARPGPRRVRVEVRLSEPGRLIARLLARGRLIAAKRWRVERRAFTVELRTPKRLSAHRARLVLRALDGAGNSATRGFTIRLQR